MPKSVRRAATAVEYGIIAGAVLLAILGSVTALGINIAAVFSGLGGSMSLSSQAYPGSPLPGITGVGGVPAWITSACALPTTTSPYTALAAAATGTPTKTVTFGCIPAGSTLTAYPQGNGGGIGYYVKTPGGQPALFAMTSGYAGEQYTFTYNQVYANVLVASDCTAMTAFGPVAGATFANNTCTGPGLTTAPYSFNGDSFPSGFSSFYIAVVRENEFTGSTFGPASPYSTQGIYP